MKICEQLKKITDIFNEELNVRLNLCIHKYVLNSQVINDGRNEI